MNRLIQGSYVWALYCCLLPAFALGQAGEGSIELLVENHMRKQAIGIGVHLETDRNCVRVDPGEGFGKVRVITDDAAGTLVFLSEKEGAKKVGMVRPLEPGSWKNKEPLDSVTYTGRSRLSGRDTLLEGVVSNERHRATYWFSPLTPFDYNKVLALLNAYKGPASGYLYNLRALANPMGFPVEFVVVPVERVADSTTVTLRRALPGETDPAAFETEGFEMFDLH